MPISYEEDAAAVHVSHANRVRVERAWAEIVDALGYDGKDPHLVESPVRVARFLMDWHTQSKHKLPPKLTTFPSEGCDELIVVGGITFYALCAHHGLPFMGVASVGYVPNGRVLGLSKFARVIDHFARRFTTQERLGQNITAYLQENLKPQGVGVVLRAEHLCMSLRGIQKPGHFTTTSDMRGVFREKPEARAEFLNLVRRST